MPGCLRKKGKVQKIFTKIMGKSPTEPGSKPQSKIRRRINWEETQRVK